MARHLGLKAALGLLLVTAAPVVAQDAGVARPPRARSPGGTTTPRYLPAMREVLEAMALAPECETLSAARARCSVRHVDAEARREIVLTLVYSDVTDTLYLFVPRLLTSAPEDSATPALLRRLMELNYRLLGPKLEWDPATGEVRLSAVLHTDSNLDRRALRSLVRTLFAVADRYQPELTRVLERADD
ncbi:MAG: CesT family type III secretion system chaperone [Deltaproteobacteria bacterium]|nr:CesT family type III secretion system chaperone [Deltaproteobacteria bacterium]